MTAPVLHREALISRDVRPVLVSAWTYFDSAGGILPKNRDRCALGGTG